LHQEKANPDCLTTIVIYTWQCMVGASLAVQPTSAQGGSGLAHETRLEHL